MKRKVHGNSKKNSRKQHLYEIYDDQEKEVFKYGISREEIDNYEAYKLSIATACCAH